MNKSELITDLTANVVRVVAINQQTDPVKLAAGVTVYAADVMEIQNGGFLGGRTIAFYVIDEGEETEAAYYKDKINAPLQSYAAAAAYLKALPSIRYRVEQQVPEDGFLLATVWNDNGDGTVSESRIMVYYDSEGNPAHRTIA